VGLGLRGAAVDEAPGLDQDRRRRRCRRGGLRGQRTNERDEGDGSERETAHPQCSGRGRRKSSRVRLGTVSFPAPTLPSATVWRPSMSVRVTCQCGTSYELKDEFAGKLVKCPQCGRENRVPAGAGSLPMQVQADPLFDRDIFLLRQQLLKISEKYDVGDEKGNNIIYVERPAHFLRNLGAAFAGIGAAIVVMVVFTTVAGQAPPASTASRILILLGSVLAFVSLIAVGVSLSAKRHVTFYRDASKRDRLIEILQDKKWQPITATYTVRDFRGQTLARFAKNILSNFFRNG